MLAHFHGFGPMKLGTSPPAETDIPRLRPVTNRLARLEARLAEAEEQRERAFAAWQASGDDEYLYRVYRANVAYVETIKQQINRATGGTR